MEGTKESEATNCQELGKILMCSSEYKKLSVASSEDKTRDLL